MPSKIKMEDGTVLYKTLYNGYYCTKDGRIFSIKVKGGQGRMNPDKPHEIAYKLNKYGYLEVVISLKNESYGKNKYIYVHKIIYETFKGKVDTSKDLTIDHIDNDSLNNHINNLQILTRVENCVKRNKDWVKAKRHHYMIKFLNTDEEIGPLDRKECNEKFGLTQSDFDRYFNRGKMPKRIKSLNIELKRV